MNDDTHIKLINQTLDAVYDALETDTPSKKIAELFRNWLEESEYDPEYAETLAMLKKALPHKFEPDHIVPVQVSNPKTKRLAVDYEIEMIYGKARGYIAVDVYGTIEGEDRKATRDEPATSRYIDGLYFKDVETGLEVPLPIGLIEYIEDEVLDNIGKCDGE